MKVLHIFKTFYPETIGGVEYVIHSLCKGLQKYDIESAIFCLTHQSNQNDVIVYDGITVYRSPIVLDVASTPFSYQAFSYLKHIAQEYDVIHCHYPYPFGDVLQLMCCWNKKIIVTYHADIVKQKYLRYLYKPLEQIFLKRAHHIVATSPQYLETSLNLQKHQHNISVIPIGLNKEHYPKPNLNNIQSYQQRFSEKFFLFVGVLRYYKGLHYLIKAAIKGGFSVVIAGDGPQKQDLQQMAEGHNNIHFLNEITNQEKVDLISACLGFVFPSHLRSEAFGISLLEAAMLGKPMISCDIGTGTSFINIHQQTGYVVEPENEDALMQYMQVMLLDLEKAQHMGMKAEKRYETLFTEEAMLKAYKKLYLTF